MSKEGRIYVKGIKRKEPDLRRLARALIQLALAEQAESDNKPQPTEVPSEEEAS